MLVAAALLLQPSRWSIRGTVAMQEVAARDGVDLSSSYAYSDSITDLPML